MTADPQRRSAASGFTLMELMIVIVLIAILSALILPEMRGSFEETLLRASARQLIGACDIAYSRAVAGGKTHRVAFNPSTGRFQVERRDTSAASRRRRDDDDDNGLPAPSGRGAQAGDATLVDAPGAAGAIDRRIVVELAGGAPLRPAAPGAKPAADADAPVEPGVDFFPDGTSEAFEFRLQDRAGFRLAVRINPITSRPKLIDLGRP